MNKYNQVLKTTGLFGGVQSLNIVLNVVRTKLVALLLGPEGVGINSIYNESRELIHSTRNLGLDVSGVRGVSAASERYDAATTDAERAEALKGVKGEGMLLRSWVLLLALFGVMVCLLLARPLSSWTFGDYDHVTGYMLLSPAVAFSTINCGELALLKGMRRLKHLALVNVLYVVLGIAVNVPIYYVWGIAGVVPALVTFTFSCAVLTCLFSFRVMRPAFVFQTRELRRGHKMLSVGLTFVVTTILSHVVLLGIMAYLNRVASEATVGLYTSAYSLIMTYTGVVFTALDQDYFPRLSGVISQKEEAESLLLRQLDVTVMLITPLLAAFIVAMPLIVPLLLSGEFRDIIPMAQVGIVGIVFRAIYLPNGYLPLAAGDNKTFLFINIIGAFDVLLVILGWHMGGLFGMGLCLTLQNLLDMLIVLGVSRWKYHIHFSGTTLLSLCGYTVLMLTVYACSLLFSGWSYWLAGLLMVTLTTAYSYNRYRVGYTNHHKEGQV